MLLEIGGGAYPRGDGWVNVDRVTNADVQWDLEYMPWPFEDGSADAIYSCHCLEHLADPLGAIKEMARIGKIRAPVEIRCPHPNADLAMTVGHKHVFSPVQVINFDRYFAKDLWTGPTRLRLLDIRYFPTFMLDEAKAELPFLAGLSDDVIMKWIPRTAHESRFYFVVETT